MKSTPIFDELSDNVKEIATLAERRGRLAAQIELMQYIKQGLEDRTISKSLGVTKIIAHLNEDKKKG